jgi:hypothetical protein
MSEAAAKHQFVLRRIRTFVLGVTALLSSVSPLLAQGAPQDKEPGDWWLQVTPYLWAAGIEGGVTTCPHTVPIDASFGDLWSKLKFAFSAHAEFGKGRVLGGIDFLTIKVGEDSIPIAAPELGTTGDFRFTTIQTELFGAYRFGGFQRPTRLDLLAGVRYTYQDQDLVIRATPIDRFRGFSEAWVDFFAGARFGADLGRRWYVSARADAGGGGAKFTANAAAGVGFRVLSWFDVDLGFRYLFLDYEDGVPGSPTFYSYNADQYGALLGFSFRF